MKIAFLVILAAAAALFLPPAIDEEQLALRRNLGKAFYENPTTQAQAVEELRRALQLAPDSARERLNYGLALLRAGDLEAGIAELEQVQKRDPKLPHTWFNLGIAYKKLRRYEGARRQLEGFLRLAPGDPIGHYNLGMIHKVEERMAEALREFETAAHLDPNLAAPRFQIYNLHREAEREADAERALKAFREAKARQTDPEATEDMEWNAYAEIYDPVEPVKFGPPAKPRWERAALGAADAKSASLIALDGEGDGRPDLLLASATGIRYYRNGTAAGQALTGRSAAVGDFNNDGLPDLCVVTAGGARLLRNAGGKWVAHPAKLPPGRYRKAVWLDYDHDYDVDLFLLGEDSRLMRNQGSAGFVDRTADFPFVKGAAWDATPFHSVPDGKGLDLVVSYAGRGGVLYRDRLLGRYEAREMAGVGPGMSPLSAVDADGNGEFEIRSEPYLDVDNRGAAAAVHEPATAFATADFDRDGREDLAVVTPAGRVELLLNRTPGSNHWIEVRLIGVKNPKLAAGTEVEIKSGTLYQKRAYHAAPLLFGLGGRRLVDTIRLTWPNGMVQNEVRQTVDRVAAVREAPRLSGSCPMIFTWNGRRFEFLTDVLGVAPLGALAGEGEFFPLDHDEYVHIPAMEPRHGRYEIRLTEELAEVTYLDQVELLALDHPAEVEVFTNDKWKAPPFPEFRLFGARRRVYPKPGTLDFGGAARDNRAVLILKGWVDWPDASSFRGAGQDRPLVPPYLQVRDTAGQWRTAIEEMGMPSGKTKTIAVDLTGKFLSASREVRIGGNLPVRWTEVFLSEDSRPPEVRLTPLGAPAAELRYRGFSRAVIDPERRRPEFFDYARVSSLGPWDPTPGMYTRYGAVDELVAEGDDRLVVMGSGDELVLRFDPAALPRLPSGWKREFLLRVTGWAKDQDANTAVSQTVEPLPFRAMSRYPYTEAERPLDRAWAERFNTRPALALQGMVRTRSRQPR